MNSPEYAWQRLSHEYRLFLQKKGLGTTEKTLKKKLGLDTLQGADLSGYDLSYADLRGADLKGARLCGADLTRAWLDGAHLNGADLSDAHMSRSRLAGIWANNDTSFENADLSRTSFSMIVPFTRCVADLRGVNMKGACLQDAFLVDVRLDGADLTGANAAGANFNSASLRGAKWEGTDFTGISDINLDWGDRRPEGIEPPRIVPNSVYLSHKLGL